MGSQDEADVLQGPLLISQKHCNKRTEPGLHSREKEIDPVEAAQTLVLEGDEILSRPMMR